VPRKSRDAGKRRGCWGGEKEITAMRREPHQQRPKTKIERDLSDNKENTMRDRTQDSKGSMQAKKSKMGWVGAWQHRKILNTDEKGVNQRGSKIPEKTKSPVAPMHDEAPSSKGQKSYR